MAKVKLNNVRCAFLSTLWEPAEFKAGDGRFRRSATFLIEKGSDNDKAVQKEIKAVATAVWGIKAEKQLKDLAPQSNKFCYTFEKSNKDGDIFEGFEGMMALSGNRGVAKGPILVLDQDARTVLDENSGKLYAGCFVNATVDVWAQKGEFAGIRCVPIGIQYVSEGDAFTGAPPARMDDFDDLTDGASADEVELGLG